MESLSKLVLGILILLIKIYQNSISRLFPNKCRYYPSCSNYTVTAIEKYGFKGLLLGVKRILSCHPFSAGGIDEVK